jgi:hypothetical protein
MRISQSGPFSQLFDVRVNTCINNIQLARKIVVAMRSETASAAKNHLRFSMTDEILNQGFYSIDGKVINGPENNQDRENTSENAVEYFEHLEDALTSIGLGVSMVNSVEFMMSGDTQTTTYVRLEGNWIVKSRGFTVS